MHNEKKPRSGFVRTAFSIAASGVLVLSMTPAAWAVETSAGNGTEFAESVQVVDASTASSHEAAESATTLTFANDGITASGTLNVDGTACKNGIKGGGPGQGGPGGGFGPMEDTTSTETTTEATSDAATVTIFGGTGIISDETATSVLSGNAGMPM